MQGYKFDGYASYLQLPSMQMDTIEIECVIDSVQPLSAGFLVDARTGLANAYLSRAGNLGSGLSKLFVEGIEKTSKLFTDIPTDRKTVVKLQAPSTFTDDLSVFSNNSNAAGTQLKGTLYTVKCYLAGVLQCAYDFVNNDTATDVSGNGRHGTLVGATPVVRAVRKKPKKNWFDGQLESGTLTTGGSTTADATRIRTKNFVPITASVGYVESNSLSYPIVRACFYDYNFNFISVGSFSSIPANSVYVKWAYTGTDLTVKAQLEQGTTATTYEPYTLIPDVRSVRVKGKKNMIPDFNKLTSKHALATVTSPYELVLNATLANQQSYFDILISGVPNVTLSFANFNYAGGQRAFVYFLNESLADIGGGLGASGASVSGAVPTGAKFARVAMQSSVAGTFVFTNPQLELGSTATPFEPYTPIPDVKPVQQGLRFNGLSDYVQLPSMQMDAIEIECLISTPKAGTWKYIVDARSGLANGYHVIDSSNNELLGAGWTKQGNLVYDQPIKIKYQASSAFTDNVNIFSREGNTDFMKGQLYSITCYLAGAVKAQYLCNEGTGTTLTDYSGNGNHGTITGATWIVKDSVRVLPVR